jgi:adenylate cyclase
MERRLAAIIYYDVVGYSRAMGEDEAGTLERPKGHRREVIDPKAAQHGGRTIKLTGDGALMEFASVVDAVVFAVAVQHGLAKRNSALPERQRLLYRIGINVGDVIIDVNDIYGDGVNVAARLESLADPGGICIHRNVRNQVRGKLDLDFEDLGEVEVRNIDRKIRAFRIVINEKVVALAAAPVSARNIPRPRWQMFTPAVLVSPAGIAALINSVSRLSPGLLPEGRRRECVHNDLAQAKISYPQGASEGSRRPPIGAHPDQQNIRRNRHRMCLAQL